MNFYLWSLVNVTLAMPSPFVKFEFVLQSVGLHKLLHMWRSVANVLMLLVYSFVCHKIKTKIKNENNVLFKVKRQAPLMFFLS